VAQLMQPQNEVLAAIETGGTKILARLVDGSGATLAEDRWATGDAADAADVLTAFVGASIPRGARLGGVGLAAFGPLVLDPLSPDCGLMLKTPKPGWTGSNLRAELSRRLDAPVTVQSDVNAAAIAEQRLGAGRGHRSVAYVTVGTGIGAGLCVDGRPFCGAMHPELGHIPVPRLPGDVSPSACPFHTDCVTGLASGPALRRRLGAHSALQDDPQTQALAAAYLGDLAATVMLAWSPQLIVWGGGVMATKGLLEQVRRACAARIGEMGVAPESASRAFHASAAFAHAGLEGALLLAHDVSAQVSKGRSACAASGARR